MKSASEIIVVCPKCGAVPTPFGREQWEDWENEHYRYRCKCGCNFMINVYKEH